MSERRILLLLAAVFAGAVAVDAIGSGAPHRITPVTVLTGVALFAPLLRRRERPVEAGLVMVILTAVVGLLPAATAPGDLLMPPVFMAYAVGAYAPAWRGAAVAALLLAAALWASPAADESPVPVAMALVCAAVVGRAVGSRRALIAQLDERNLELEAEEAAFSRLAVHHERARIARELHDIVAHHIAVIVVQAGAGRLARPEDAAVRMASIRDSGEQALAEMARLVEVLHVTGGAAAPGRLSATLDRARAGGMQLTAEIPDRDLPEPVADVVHRVVQEALTNVLKHAPGVPVRVRVREAAGGVEVEVLNERPAAGASSLAATGSGLGLTGMRERVEGLGGRLHAGIDDGGGWRVHAVLPAAPAPAAGQRP